MQIFQEEVDIWGNWNRVTFFKTENKKRVLALSILFNSIDNGPFRGCPRMGQGGGDKKNPLFKICHVSYNNKIWCSYTLPKEDRRNKLIGWYTPWVLLTSAFFNWKSPNFAISRNRDMDCIFIHNFYSF